VPRRATQKLLRATGVHIRVVIRLFSRFGHKVRSSVRRVSRTGVLPVL
jgi:hypothetical protein